MRVGRGNALRFPHPCVTLLRSTVHPCVAGGFGSWLVVGSARECGKGDGPCNRSGAKSFGSSGGKRKRIAFPRPRGTVLQRPVQPAPREASARPGGGEAPADGGAGAGRGLEPRLGKGQRGGMAKAMAFAMATALAVPTLAFCSPSGPDKASLPELPTRALCRSGLAIPIPAR